jgi:hypothetical protein
MSEESLRRFMERLNADAAFRDTVQRDVAAAFAEFEISPAEQVALACNDEDALRRLAGADVQAYAAPGTGLPAGGEAGVEAKTFWFLCTSIFCGNVTRNYECSQGHCVGPAA